MKLFELAIIIISISRSTIGQYYFYDYPTYINSTNAKIKKMVLIQVLMTKSFIISLKATTELLDLDLK